MKDRVNYVRQHMWVFIRESPSDKAKIYGGCFNAICHLLLGELNYLVNKAIEDETVDFEKEMELLLKNYDFGEDDYAIQQSGYEDSPSYSTFKQSKGRFEMRARRQYRNKEMQEPHALWGKTYYDGTPLNEVWDMVDGRWVWHRKNNHNTNIL